MSSQLLDKALHDLDFARIEAAVRAHRVAPASVPFALPLAASYDAATVALAQTAEALALLERGEPLPLEGLYDVGPHLARLERHGDLDVHALHEVRLVLRAARLLRRFLASRRAVAPELANALTLDPTLDELLAQLDSSLDPEGTLADHASPELRRLRIETRNLRSGLVSRLEELVLKHAELLSDRFHTIRDGRYVIPVRSDAHERVHGIVHGTSSSGATIFVEPRSLISAGNRLKLAEAEQEREETRLLAVLSAEVRARLSSVDAGFAALLHADLRAASARFSRSLGLTRPVLSKDLVISLKRARHPSLLLDGVAVVANDVEARAGQALVISGPNAGGKTVALKLLGLSALMARAGLFIAAEEGSSTGFFEHVLSDIGDEQSLEKSLSTFSAHVTQLREILELAGPSTLVLLDELAGSTDPEEGGALACAVVEVLCERGAAVAVTTHYEPLKARALTNPALRNASVGFDVASMQPTFRLRLDVPGASSALSVAERFGLSRAITDRARAILPERTRDFDQLVHKLSSQLAQAEASVAAVSAELERTRSARAAIESELAALKAREKKQLGAEAARLLETLREARAELDRAKKELRHNNKDAGRLREIAARMAGAEAMAERPEVVELVEPQREAPAATAVTLEQLEVGVRVYVPHLRAEAEVLERSPKGRVRIGAGAMRLWVDVSEVRLPLAREPTKGVETAPRSPRPARAAVRTAENSLDLRGMRVDDALDLLDAFLDRMYGRDESAAYIEHGVGSGALRDAVRAQLARSSRYISGFRPGAPEEGGERITVVTLA